MDNQQLQKWALVAEVIGGLAVIFSLIFVAFEVRQSSTETALNTRAISVSSYQDLISQIMEINTQTIIDPELMDLVQRGEAGEIDSVTESNDARRYRKYRINLTRHADLACFQYQQGFISRERLAAAIAIYLAEVIEPHPELMPRPDATTTPGLRECVDIAIEMRASSER